MLFPKAVHAQGLLNATFKLHGFTRGVCGRKTVVCALAVFGKSAVPTNKAKTTTILVLIKLPPYVSAKLRNFREQKAPFNCIYYISYHPY
jgi:hypothetical protein